MLQLEPLQHGHFVLELRVAQSQPDQKPVQLRFRQRKSAFVVNRILGGDQEKRRCQFIVVSVGGHLPLGHGFEQGGLGARRGAIDFVGQHDLREERAGPELELGRLRIENGAAGDVVGQQVGVHWMRLNVQPMLRARARASMVLATPGTSSSSTWPSAQYATSVSTISLCLPTITFSMLSMMRLATGVTGELARFPLRRGDSVWEPGPMAAAREATRRFRLRSADILSEFPRARRRTRKVDRTKRKRS